MLSLAIPLALSNLVHAATTIPNPDPAANNEWFSGDRGGAIALNSDSSVALIGAYGKTSSRGIAYFFDPSAGALLGQLIASNPAANDSFGWSVALNSSTGLVGAFNKAGGGLAYLFDLSSGVASATQITMLKGSDTAAGDVFGWTVALNDSYALIGA